MSEQSQEHIPISTDFGVSWNFVIAPERSVDNQREEMVSKTKKLFNCFDNFLYPYETNYNILFYSNDTTPDKYSSVNPTQTIERIIIYDGEGFIEDNLNNSVNEHTTGTAWIPHIKFDHNEYRVYLGGEKRVVDRTDCIQYQNGQPMQELPVWDPIEIVISHDTTPMKVERQTDFVFQISISLRSDLWISQTEQGMFNRRNLSAFLYSIDEQYQSPVIERDVYVTSDMWSDLNTQVDPTEFDPQEIY